MTDYLVREPKIVVPPEKDEGRGKSDEGYFRYNPYDPRAADSGGFGYGGTNGSAGGWGAGGMGPQTGEYGSQANYGSGPEYNARDGATTSEMEWVDGEEMGQASGTHSPDEARNLPPLKSRWAEGHVAHAPSHPGPAKSDDEA